MMSARLDSGAGRVVTRDEEGSVRVWELPLDRDWPADALELRLAAETGTAMSETGELRVLPPAQWRRVRYCEYDRIRHALGRLDAPGWEEARRRCLEAQSEGESESGHGPVPSLLEEAGIRH